MKQAAPGEVPPVQIAMLEDRIRTFEGRGQLYGTQFDWDEQGRLSPMPIEDPDNVDERRATVGLGPLSEDLERRRATMPATGEKPPADRSRREQEIKDWLRRVGWRE
jgi:hypothetical protein